MKHSGYCSTIICNTQSTSERMQMSRIIKNSNTARLKLKRSINRFRVATNFCLHCWLICCLLPSHWESIIPICRSQVRITGEGQEGQPCKKPIPNHICGLSDLFGWAAVATPPGSSWRTKKKFINLLTKTECWRKQWKLFITVSQSPNWRLQMFCFVQPRHQKYKDVQFTMI